MKRKFQILVAVALAVSILLGACAPAGGESEGAGSQPEVADSTPAAQAADQDEHTAAVDATPHLAFQMDLQEILSRALDNHDYLFAPITAGQIVAFQSGFGAIDAEKDQATARAITAYLDAADAEWAHPYTQAQAEEDIELLMDYLACAYIGYQYFGGEDVFEPIREDLLRAVADMGDAVYHHDFLSLLQDKLYPVLRDNHFLIDRRSKELFTYVSREQFTLEGGNYLDTDTQSLLESVVIGDETYLPQDVLLPWLHPNGRMTYRVVAQAGEAPKVTLVYPQGEQAAELLTVLSGERRLDRSADWELESIDNIPVLRCYSLQITQENSTSAVDDFVASARQLQEEPYLIVDLRGNSGGYAPATAEWLGVLADQDPQRFTDCIVSAILFSDSIKAVLPNSQVGYLFEDAFDEYADEIDYPGALSVVEPIWPQPIPSDQVIFVLVDRFTGSAAEFFTNYLCMLDQTVVVGTNTAGAFHFGNIMSLDLPHSRIKVEGGISATLLPDFALHEIQGFAPDLWCHGEDALESVIELIKQMEAQEASDH